jgi:D-tyrosyl-tRNA(Tyr) deacylase
MKVLLQRVARAVVRIDGAPVGAIGRGLLVFLGVEHGDTIELACRFADKAAELRIFSDAEGRLNRSVLEAGGEVLVVSQFTLVAETRRGRRPSFSRAAQAALAEDLYRRFAARLADRGLRVATGVFGARMEVDLVNDGPVTILLDPPHGEA